MNRQHALRNIGVGLVTTATVAAVAWLNFWLTSSFMWAILLTVAYAGVVLFYGALQKGAKNRIRVVGGNVQEAPPDSSNVPADYFALLRYRLRPGEVVYRAVRRHKIVLLASYLLLGIGTVLVIGGVTLFAAAYEFSFSVPDLLPRDSPSPSSPTLHNVTTPVGRVVGALVLITGLLSILVALYAWEKWRGSMVLVSDLRIIIAREHPPVFFWMGRDFDDIPWDQVIDVKDKASVLGLALRYGHISLKRQMISIEANVVEIRFSTMPDVAQLADLIRSLSPRIFIQKVGHDS